MCAKECEYGDREQWCQDISAYSCYNVADSCCQTCPELRIQDAQPGKIELIAVMESATFVKIRVSRRAKIII